MLSITFTIYEIKQIKLDLANLPVKNYAYKAILCISNGFGKLHSKDL